MAISKSSKMLQHINYRMRVTIQDGRQLVGKFMAFDRHMNIVLGDCEEFRKLPPGKNGSKINEPREVRRTIGMVLLRGEEVVSMTVEGPPPVDESRVKLGSGSGVSGPGIGRGAGRGVVTGPVSVQAQPGLAGPVRGVGGPGPGMMQPQIMRPPVIMRPTGQLPQPPPVFNGQGVGQVMIGRPPVYGVRPPQFPPPQMGQFGGQRPMMMRGPPPPRPPGGVHPVFAPPRPPNQQQ